MLITLRRNSYTKIASFSTVSKGLAFELECIRVLQQYSFQLIRVGGKDDRGIDLRGTWQFFSKGKQITNENKYDANTEMSDEKEFKESLKKLNRKARIEIIAQCKNTPKTSVGPQVLRDFSSCLLSQQDHHHRHGNHYSSVHSDTISSLSSKVSATSISSSSNDTSKSIINLGILLTSGKFSKGTYSLHHRTRLPLILGCIRQEKLVEFKINYAVQQLLPQLVISRKQKNSSSQASTSYHDANKEGSYFQQRTLQEITHHNDTPHNDSLQKDENVDSRNESLFENETEEDAEIEIFSL